MMLRGLYTILLGLFLTLFIGIGISTFYPEPIYQTPTLCMEPARPDMSAPITASPNPQECQKAQMALQEKTNFHSQVVASIALVAAVIYVVLGLLIFRSQPVFSYGFLFGSMFTLFYSLLRGLNSNQPAFTFVIVVISLVIVMVIGYQRFVKVDTAKKKNCLSRTTAHA